MKTLDAEAIMARATPLAHQPAPEIHPSGHLVRMPIALSETACTQSVENLNQILADTWCVAEHVVDAPLVRAEASVSEGAKK
jgi:hypothetical protein